VELDVIKIDMPEAGRPVHLRRNPLKTDKVTFNIYNFQPWQALGMHRHTGNDEVLYVIEGGCFFYVEGERRAVGASHAVYVPAGAMHAVLSCGRPTTILSVQGPSPVSSIYGTGLEYFCPVCQLETPVTTNTHGGGTTVCPRCKAMLKLKEAGEALGAEIVEKPGPSEARA